MLNKVFVVLALALFVSADKCPFDQRCMSCYSGECQACYKSYPSNGECVEPKRTVKHCISYTNDNYCLSCEEGWYLDFNSGECNKIEIENCAYLNYDGANGCFICSNGRQVANNKCDGPECTQENCTMCTKDFCLECKEGYVLDQSLKCIRSTVPNCFMWDDYKNGCVACNVGYYQSGDACLRSEYFDEEDTEEYHDRGYGIWDAILDFFNFTLA